ncbi:MAG: hypothetical protein J6M18_04035 [Actinomycetaceae bacterium]|nr:hypothetical protein [Actinomycetaceae bacterium]
MGHTIKAHYFLDGFQISVRFDDNSRVVYDLRRNASRNETAKTLLTDGFLFYKGGLNEDASALVWPSSLMLTADELYENGVRL